MPRKQFKADLEDAIQGKHGLEFISDCCVLEDGFTFTFAHPALASPITITASVPEQSDYPGAHYYTLFCDDSASKDVAHTVDRLGQPSSMTINQFLSHVSDALCRSTNIESDAESWSCNDSDEDLDDEDIYGGGFETAASAPVFAMPTKTNRTNPSSQFQSRIRSDLKCARDAGFRISCFGGLFDNFSCVVSLSISARKLGISEEAMQAWRIEPSDYIIILIQYKEGYKTKEELMALAPSSIPAHLDMRVGVSKYYKPTQEQVIKAFSATGASTTQDSSSAQFRDTFISKPLKDLLSERLVYVVRYRDAGMSWQGAEDSYRMRQTDPDVDVCAIASHYEKEETPSYPAVVTADHLGHRSKAHSFPLAAIQFTLRHFVRCIEFCLVCHKKLDTLVEALKPYVCDEPLCLYQYMTLGFGPSIEHEIMHQDKVVDLLLSFCYSSASLGRLKDFPTGLALSVPGTITSPIQEQTRGLMNSVQPALPSASASPKSKSRLEARFDMVKSEILFDYGGPTFVCPVRKGDWVALELPDETGSPSVHCRIQDTLGPSAQTGPLIRPATHKDLRTTGWVTVFVDKYTTNFDDLPDAEKRGTVQRLLALLPSVRKMKAYLLEQSTPNLSRWVDMISPAALSVLRWTLASNRSCIVEVEPDKAVHGMGGYMQFRFAMGAPDKEHRFLTAVKDTTARLKSRYQTMYAWHGSLIQNWHSIIREGLHFNETLNGRAYGHGVYHSPHYSTSLGYSGMHASYLSTPGSHMWPKSDLQISGAIALNEIVNAPDEFVSKHPHYVISQLDWIQTRYLFVKCGASDDVILPKFDQLPEHKLEQDPTRIPMGEQTQITIPALRVKTGKRKLANTESPGLKKTKKAKKGPKSKNTTKVIDLTGSDDDEIESHFNDSELSDSLSVATDDEDREIFEEPKSRSQLAIRTGSPQTGFVPGSLDHDQLPKLPVPSYANTMTTKRLSQDLKALLDVQTKTPLHELGWYIDPSKVENLYQMIVEFHSFSMFNDGNRVLPLVTDMKKYNIKSIVLELRFPASYPNNPPFIRVIRPRFLPFMNGGGGHVTAGGAICHALLTTDGWLCTTTIESVLLQIRMAMASVEPKPARLQIRGAYTAGDANSYGSREAIEAYKRACMTHGWTVPSDFDQTVAEEPQQQ
jgi:ubiquitin-conjugating enzyme E2 Q